MRPLKLLWVVIIISFVSYAYGVVTFRNKVFPYYQLKALGQSLNLGKHEKSVNKKIRSNIKKNKYNAHYYHKKTFFDQHSQHDYDIVFVGDSITEQAEWEDLFPSFNIANRGIRGDTTTGILRRIDGICSTNALKAFIMIGLNDFTAGKSVAEVLENYKQIVSRMTDHDISVCIQSTILAGEPFQGVNLKIIELNRKLIDLANKNQLITYIDLNKELAPNSALDKKYSYDYIHLNGDGYAVWQKVIRSEVISVRNSQTNFEH